MTIQRSLRVCADAEVEALVGLGEHQHVVG